VFYTLILKKCYNKMVKMGKREGRDKEEKGKRKGKDGGEDGK
jgi:hypothetical protein